MNNITTYGAGARGVNAFGVGVAAVAVSGAIVTHGDNAPAIVLSTYGVSLNGNSISVTGPSSSSITTTGAYSRGIDARAYGAGSSANINIGSVTTSGLKGGFGFGQPNSTGIFVATSDGALSVAAGSISTAGVGADGVDAVSNSGPISVRVGSVSTTGEVGAGISAASVSGPISLQAASISTSGRASDAIDATSNGSISVSTGAVQTAGTGSLGILVDSAADAATVTSQSVITHGDGGAGVFGAGGIYAESDKNVVINSGVVTTYGAHAGGIVAVSTLGNAAIDITGAGVNSPASVAVFALGVQVSVTTAAGSAITGGLGGIRLESTDGSTLDLAGQVGSASGFAIQSLEGSVTANNSGSINGAVSLPFGGDTVNNTGAFNAVGDSVFSAGDVFNNSGSVNILPGAQPAAGNVTFLGLATFNNTGLINLSNGRVGDTLTLPGVAFNGGAGSLLALDVNFGGSGSQTSCATATLADCLVLPGGTASGVTGVRITNVGTAPSQAAGGIVVVDAPGGTIAPGAFVLDPGSRGFEMRGGAGAVSSGFFFYRLVPLGSTQEALVSAPDNTAYEFTQFGAAATDVWYTTTGTWFEREADLREGLSDAGTPAGHGDVWLKAVGDWSRRNSSQSTTSLGTTFTFDTSYRQSTAAIIGGADLLRGVGRALVLGVDGGYVDSDVRFSASPTFARLSGGVVGGYASLLSGRWYLDATVNYNFLTLSDTIASLVGPSGTGTLAASGNVRSLGGQVESGWRLPVGAFSVEPLASIAYVRTRFDDLNVPGGSVQFGDVDSLRGSLGLRLSSDIHMADYTIKPSVFARAWDEFRGDENTALIDGGETIPGFDRFRGVFGDVGGQMAVFSKGGVAAFLNGDYKFKSNYRDYTARVGIRYSF
ncbi:MAG: autotransporter domain-containing protein [Pseudomonadota bacterium]|nr:autotransporter domain-containing protein [Pseudomonadota bacterium]